VSDIAKEYEKLVDEDTTIVPSMILAWGTPATFGRNLLGPHRGRGCRLLTFLLYRCSLLSVHNLVSCVSNCVYSMLWFSYNLCSIESLAVGISLLGISIVQGFYHCIINLVTSAKLFPQCFSPSVPSKCFHDIFHTLEDILLKACGQTWFLSCSFCSTTFQKRPCTSFKFADIHSEHCVCRIQRTL